MIDAVAAIASPAGSVEPVEEGPPDGFGERGGQRVGVGVVEVPGSIGLVGKHVVHRLPLLDKRGRCPLIGRGVLVPVLRIVATLPGERHQLLERPRTVLDRGVPKERCDCVPHPLRQGFLVGVALSNASRSTPNSAV